MKKYLNGFIWSSTKRLYTNGYSYAIYIAKSPNVFYMGEPNEKSIKTLSFYKL